MDIVDKARRSAMMAAIRGKDTKPEMLVRRTAHALGFRYSLHRRDLPGSPDLVFPGRRKVVFVHGCYWHRHPGCRFAYEPKSNVDFWTRKFDRNVERDRQALTRLKELGWNPLVIWECECDESEAIAQRLLMHLGQGEADDE